MGMAGMEQTVSSECLAAAGLATRDEQTLQGVLSCWGWLAWGGHHPPKAMSRLHMARMKALSWRG